MKSIPLNKYLEMVGKAGGAMDDEANILPPTMERPNYSNYTPVSNRANSYGQNEGVSYSGRLDALFSRAIREGQNEGKIHDSKGSYIKFASSGKYTIFPYAFNGLTEQRVPFSSITDKGLLGRTWIDTLTNPKSELSDELEGIGLDAVREHEVSHQINKWASELKNRGLTKDRLLTKYGTLAGTFHDTRYV